MSDLKHYQKKAKDAIASEKLTANAFDRITETTRDLLKTGDYIIDTHAHFFDMQCINAWYFIAQYLGWEKLANRIKKKNIKSSELFTLLSDDKVITSRVNFSEKIYEDEWYQKFKEEIKNTPSILEPEFDDDFLQEKERIIELMSGLFNSNEEIQLHDFYEEITTKESQEKKFIESGGSIYSLKKIKNYTELLNLLGLTQMSEVYDIYINKYSPTKAFNSISNASVLSTALMMDFRCGWGLKTQKSLLYQIEELKDLSKSTPILPYLFCDPRRADIEEDNENLYELFDHAFCTETPFFGVKIYPSLGYDPNDIRLHPIYELCQEFSIPVLTHCGSDTIRAYDNENFDVSLMENEKILMDGKKFRELSDRQRADWLNHPARWQPVLEKYKKLRLNIAHFGGEVSWLENERNNRYRKEERKGRKRGEEEKKMMEKRKEHIIELMSYDNVYSDFSYSIENIEATKLLVQMINVDDKIKHRTLFGTDFWVILKEGKLDIEVKKFVKELNSEELTQRLFQTNPLEYLFSKENFKSAELNINHLA